MTRVCIHCLRELDETEFYRTRNSLDTACKDCRKKAVSERYRMKSQDPAYVEKERKRGRDKYHRLGYVDKYKTDSRNKKAKLYSSLRNAKRDFHADISADMELHHWNYNITDQVILLDRRLHHTFHTTVSLNVDEGLYYRGDEKLDTVDKHLSAIKDVCDDFGFDYSKVEVITK